MATNPSTSRAECNLHAGMVNQDSINNPRTTNNESYNSFDKSCLRLDTQLFDEIRACYMSPAIEGDVKRINMVQDLRSPTLKSPLLTPVNMHRSFFQVPWSVIMPNTWEYVYRNPVRGDDIVFDDVAPILSLKSFVKPSVHLGVTTDLTKAIELYIRTIYLYQSMFGASALPRQLKIRFPDDNIVFTPQSDYFDSSIVTFDSANSIWDTMMSALCRILANDAVLRPSSPDAGDSFSIFQPEVGQPVRIGYTDAFTQINRFVEIASPSDAFNFLREFILYSAPGSLNLQGLTLNAGVTVDFLKSTLPVLTGAVKGSTITFNLMPLIAYQCVVAQYFTNDHIDAVYSAKMWHSNALSAIYDINSIIVGTYRPSYAFEYNGVDVPYDAYSGINLSSLLEFIGLQPKAFSADQNILAVQYLQNLFIVGQSLRYGDYFTSSRTQPLAVGDVSAAVDSQSVSAVDMNRAQWIQRFLNAVNRCKQSIYDYIESLSGVLPARREPQPNFIITEDYRLGGMEIENTAENQGNIVTLFRNTESRNIYDVFIDEPSFVIGLDYFSASYAYTDACDKVEYMQDRLDWFNHFMQHIGDQSVDRAELTSSVNIGIPFAYQLRYAQFKFGISDALGGFIADDTQLDTWALLFKADGARADETSVLSPSFIRNHNSDFDAFYSVLTGYNNANRFHFIKSIYFRDLTNSKQQAFPSLL